MHTDSNAPLPHPHDEHYRHRISRTTRNYGNQTSRFSSIFGVNVGGAVLLLLMPWIREHLTFWQLSRMHVCKPIHRPNFTYNFISVCMHKEFIPLFAHFPFSHHCAPPSAQMHACALPLWPIGHTPLLLSAPHFPRIVPCSSRVLPISALQHHNKCARARNTSARYLARPILLPNNTRPRQSTFKMAKV